MEKEQRERGKNRGEKRWGGERKEGSEKGREREGERAERFSNSQVPMLSCLAARPLQHWKPSEFLPFHGVEDGKNGKIR